MVSRLGGGKEGQGGGNQGVETAARLLDISKCYERIPLTLLATRAVQQGWPRTVVLMAVGQYAAVRCVCVWQERWSLEGRRGAG